MVMSKSCASFFLLIQGDIAHLGSDRLDYGAQLHVQGTGMDHYLMQDGLGNAAPEKIAGR
jgi:hypothetical protein